MNQDIESKMSKTPTPGRRLGLSRISPRPIATPSPQQSSSTLNDTQQKTKTPNSTPKLNAEKRPIVPGENNLFVTPIKKRKCLGRFSITPKQINTPTPEECSVVKTSDDLKAEIAKMKTHLEKYERYKIEKNDLEQLITKWTDGGRQALQQLKSEIDPQKDIEQILQYLNIPTDIFGNFTDE